MPEDNGKQNPEESYTKKYQKNIVCRYGCKLAYVDDKFNKPFKTYLGKDAVYSFINSIIKKRKCCSEVIKKHLNKELGMTKDDNEGFKNSTKCCICENRDVDNDVKIRNHCHIAGEYRGSVHRDCNINLKLNHKNPILFRNLKKYYSHLIM